MPLPDEEDPLLVKLGAGLAGQHGELRFVELHGGVAMWDSCVIYSVLLYTPTNNVTESFTGDSFSSFLSLRLDIESYKSYKQLKHVMQE